MKLTCLYLDIKSAPPLSLLRPKAFPAASRWAVGKVVPLASPLHPPLLLHSFYLFFLIDIYFFKFLRDGLFKPENKTGGKRLKTGLTPAPLVGGGGEKKKIPFHCNSVIVYFAIHILIWLPPCQSGRAGLRGPLGETLPTAAQTIRNKRRNSTKGLPGK